MLTHKYVPQIMYTFAKPNHTLFIYIYVFIDVFKTIFQLKNI